MSRTPKSRRPVRWKVLLLAAAVLMAAGQRVFRAAHGTVEFDSAWDVLPIVAIGAAFLLMVFARVFRTDGRKTHEIEWEEVRRRELERRHHRLENSLLPSAREED